MKNVGLLEGGVALILDFIGSHYRFWDNVSQVTGLCTIHISSFPCLCNYHVCFWDTGKRAMFLKCVVGHPSLGHERKKEKKTEKEKK